MRVRHTVDAGKRVLTEDRGAVEFLGGGVKVGQVALVTHGRVHVDHARLQCLHEVARRQTPTLLEVESAVHAEGGDGARNGLTAEVHRADGHRGSIQPVTGRVQRQLGDHPTGCADPRPAHTGQGVPALAVAQLRRQVQRHVGPREAVDFCFQRQVQAPPGQGLCIHAHLGAALVWGHEGAIGVGTLQHLPVLHARIGHARGRTPLPGPFGLGGLRQQAGLQIGLRALGDQPIGHVHHAEAAPLEGLRVGKVLPVVVV